MSENKVPLKLENNSTLFADIFDPGKNGASYGNFVDTPCGGTLLGTVIWLYRCLATPHCHL
jgi:hypothetical protein